MASLNPRQIPRPLTVGEIAKRSGVAASTVRFYETEGLIKATRNAGNQRRFARETLRRVAIIKVAQRLGIPLAAIREALKSLPEGRTPTATDWNKLSARWREELETRIARLQQLRDQLSSCIGCGCLSLKDCPLRNPLDRLSEQGAGPRLLDTEE